MQFVLSLLIKTIKTAAVQKLILEAAELLVKRTDTTFDDKALEIVREVVEKTTLLK